MSTLLHLFDESRRRISVRCDDSEATLWVRDGENTVSIQVTPRVLLQLRAALNEVGKYLSVEEV